MGRAPRDDDPVPRHHRQRRRTVQETRAPHRALPQGIQDRGAEGALSREQEVAFAGAGGETRRRSFQRMEVSWALLANAVIAGLLLGGFYAAMSVGISISFGMLDVVNIAHPAFIILGSYIAYIVNDRFGLDPIVVSLLVSPLFFLLGAALYRVYYYSFERRGQESLRGVDYRMVSSRYGDVTWRAGEVGFPMRLVVPFLVSMVMVIGVQLFLTHTFFGRAVLAVEQDPLALRLMGVNPVRVKELAFAISIATAGVAGAFLIVIQPVQPAIGREFIGLVFAVCVLGGMGSIWGTLLGAFVLGLAESFTSTYFGPSWAPAVSFGLLLATLAFRPSGLLGR